MREFRSADYEAEAIEEAMPSAVDQVIFGRPSVGELIIRYGYPRPHAGLYNRFSRSGPEHIAGRSAALLDRGVPAHHITTITKDGERARPFDDEATSG